jgi:subtilisin family serine protease
MNMRRSSRATRFGAAAATAGLVLMGLAGTGSAQAAPTPLKITPGNLKRLPISKSAKLAPRLSAASADKTMTVFVQLSGQGAADVSVKAEDLGRSAKTANGEAKVRRAQVHSDATEVTAQAKKTDSSTRRLFTTSNSVPGLGMTASVRALRDIAKRSDVVKITPITPKTPDNAASGELIKALATWQQTGITGKGVRVGVIDTGIDYTHADFGGPGTPAAYDAAHATADSGAAWTPTAKVVGGYDFVGDSYDGDAQPVPHPDPNPLDCEGHGTHVAGTAAGYGVTAAGKTFTGSYRSLSASTLRSMSIGPGMAPQASLYALRVFGCEGTTDMVLPALDWALDPNGDGNFADHLDIVNLSLGADFGAPDDPEATVVNSLAKHGVLPVFSSGNAGDITDIGGAPGNAERALTVANSVDAYNLLDGLKVDAPANVAGTVAGQMSVAYPWASKPAVTGTVVQLSDSANKDGCATLSAADKSRVAGKVAWLEWDDNEATRRCGSAVRSNNVAAAGASGALFTSTLSEFSAGITGSATIPVFQLNGAATTKLRPAATADTLRVTFDGKLALSTPVVTPAAVDTLNDSSSRGTHGAPGVVKPDVTAPGTTIISAAVGSGNGRANLSGTSMAAPHIAGVAALVKKQHPSWTVEQIKAAVMNTAVHDLYTGQNKSGNRYGPARVGAGRTDARYAVSTVLLAYSKSKPGVVSASFGVVEAPITAKKVAKTQLVTVQNKAFSKRTVTLSYAPVIKQPGVSYSVSPKKLRLKARSKATVKVTMTVKPSSLRRTLDPTMSATTVSDVTGEEGARQFVSDASGHLLVKPSGKAALRVPVYGAAKPVSATSVAATTAKGAKVLKVSGKGIVQGSGRSAYESIGSALSLGSTSRKLPTCAPRQVNDCVLNTTARGVDLQYTGLGSIPGDASSTGIGWFGFSTWGNWTSMASGGGQVEFDIDTNADAKPDFTVVYYPSQTDQPKSIVYDSDGPFAAYPVNFFGANTGTNAYDTNVATLPFLLSDLGVPDDATSFPIRYRAASYSGFYGNPDTYLVDSTGWVSADLAKPALRVADPLFADRSGTTVPYSVNASSTAAAAKTGAGASKAEAGASDVGSTQALILHLHGKAGQRAEVLTVR